MRIRRLLGLVLTSAAPAAGPRPAAATRGVLTRSEYQQLRLAQSRIRSLAASDTRSFRRANAVCARMRSVSPLITAVRSGCLDLIRLAGDDGRLNARATRCGINPPSASAILACLVPAVRSYYADAEAFYRAESLVTRLATARGFSRTCVAVIGDSPGNVAAEGRLAQDLKEAVTALQHRNPDALQTLTTRLHADLKSIRRGPTSLSLCPHR